MHDVHTEWVPVAALSGVIVVLAGLLAAPIVFAGRVMPGIIFDGISIGGARSTDIQGIVEARLRVLQSQSVTVRLPGKEVDMSLKDLGATPDADLIMRAVEGRRSVVPRIVFVPLSVSLDARSARSSLEAAFADELALPQNATLRAAGSSFVLVASRSGETIDVEKLESDVRSLLAVGSPLNIQLGVVSSAPSIVDSEVEAARAGAEALLREGFRLVYEGEEYRIPPSPLRRLLIFMPQQDLADSTNDILGVALDPDGLTAFLESTIRSEVDRVPLDARFTMSDSGLAKIEDSQQGRSLDVVATREAITQALGRGQFEASLVVTVETPRVASPEDIENLNITTLLATGESDFVGSPKNRVHNIHVGASRYNGLLLPSGEEFSFNRHLGPVTAAAGFKPELVIKEHVTTPEYGGGLCQVSTTIFRAAVHSGLEVTQRRNHSYAVSYYGTPGFDATIYPPYTDLRFLNNTPGTILIQTRIEGTKLLFEFWGTDDGRSVEVAGPTPYNRTSDGAVKASLTQRVTRDGEVVVEDMFYSNYKSPKLFPKTYEQAQPPSSAASAGAGDQDTSAKNQKTEAKSSSS